jgi:hypothetical protein
MTFKHHERRLQVVHAKLVIKNGGECSAGGNPWLCPLPTPPADKPTMTTFAVSMPAFALEVSGECTRTSLYGS